jgi:hypothetical protein
MVGPLNEIKNSGAVSTLSRNEIGTSQKNNNDFKNALARSSLEKAIDRAIRSDPRNKPFEKVTTGELRKLSTAYLVDLIAAGNGRSAEAKRVKGFIALIDVDIKNPNGEYYKMLKSYKKEKILSEARVIHRDVGSRLVELQRQGQAGSGETGRLQDFANALLRCSYRDLSDNLPSKI